MEARLERLQRGVGPCHGADHVCDLVAVAVRAPRRVLTGRRALPGHLVAARCLLAADRRPAAELTDRYGRTLQF